MSSTPGGLPDPTYFQDATSSRAATSNITVALPATRQIDKPAKSLRTPKLGNPAVPVAGAVSSANARQQAAAAEGMTEQGLAFGRNSDRQQHPAEAQAGGFQPSLHHSTGQQPSAVLSPVAHQQAAQDSLHQLPATQSHTQSTADQGLAPQYSVQQSSPAPAPMGQTSASQSPSLQPQVSGVGIQDKPSNVVQQPAVHQQVAEQDGPAPDASAAPQVQSGHSQDSVGTGMPQAVHRDLPGQTSNSITPIAAQPRRNSPVRARIQELEQRESQQGLLPSQLRSTLSLQRPVQLSVESDLGDPVPQSNNAYRYTEGEACDSSISLIVPTQMGIAVREYMLYMCHDVMCCDKLITA